MFSDFILSKQPSTVKEAMKVYEEISKNSGTLSNKHKFASPMHVTLTPLKFVSYKYIGKRGSYFESLFDIDTKHQIKIF